MRDLVIDLGELRDDDPTDHPTGRPPQRWRALLAIVAVLCAVTLTGSVRDARPVPVTRIPAQLGDVTFLGDHEYFVIGSTTEPPNDPVQNKLVNVYALPSGRLLSRTSVMVTGAIRQVLAVGDVVMVTYESDDVGAEATAAYTAGTGHAVWRRYGRLFGLAPSRRVVVLHEVTAGVPTARWSGVDSGTGALRWQFVQPKTDAGELVAGTGATSDRLVSVTASGRIEVRSTDTGRVVAAVSAPASWRARGQYLGTVAGLVLLGDPSGTIAYALTDLRERWRSSIDLSSFVLRRGCGDVICFSQVTGMRVLDAATGRQRWASTAWADAQRAGKVLLASTAAEPPAVVAYTAVDPADGRPLGTLGGWQPTGDARPDGRVPVLREQSDLRRVWYGLLDPVTRAVRVLGTADQVSACGSTPDALVCRMTDASSAVWPFVLP